MNNKYQPYCYLIGWSSLHKYYYGVSFRKGTHPSDLWKKYFTSSKKVAEYRTLYGEPDIIQVRKTFKNSDQAISWEHKVINRMGMILAGNKWLNMNCAGSIPGHIVTLTQSGRPKHSQETKDYISSINKGRIRTQSHKDAVSRAHKGKLVSQHTRQLISEKMKEHKRSKEHNINNGLAHRKLITIYSQELKKTFTYTGINEFKAKTSLCGPVLNSLKDTGTYTIKRKTKRAKHPFPLGDVISLQSLYV